MKKMFKLTIVGAILLSVVIATSNISFAANEYDINDILQSVQAEEIPEESESETEETISESTSTPETTTTTPESTSTTETTTTTSESTSTTETTTTTSESTSTTPEATTQTKTATEVVEETKLPQTGETENYVIVLAVIAFIGIAVYAYMKSKKYSIK